MEQENRKAQEIWETTTGGTTFVHVKDPRNPDGWVQKKVGGRGTKRITLTVEEREFNQELVTYENKHHDPFTNGLLVRISPKDVDRGQFEVTDEELIALLQGGTDEEFSATIKKTDSEVILRRMLALAERNTTMHRFQELQEVIDIRFSIGKTQKVVQEMFEDDARYQGADL